MFVHGQEVTWRTWSHGLLAPREGKFIGLSTFDKTVAIVETKECLQCVKIADIQSSQPLKQELHDVLVSLPTGNMFLSCLGTCGNNGEFVPLLPKYIVSDDCTEVQRISDRRGDTCTLQTVVNIHPELMPDQENTAFRIAALLNGKT